MREILFKAKRIDNGEWVEGYVFDDGFENGRMFVGGLVIEEYKGTACDDWDITGINFYEVDKDTICQYTGLIDKNGKKILENDIVSLNGCGHGFGETEIVKYEKGGFSPFSVAKWECTPESIDCVVVGNIFDNTDLLNE